jgi:hypothetical protein
MKTGSYPLYSGDASMAFDFASCLFPTDFCVFLRVFVQTNEGVVRRFMTWFCRVCSLGLGWPIWSAVSCPDNDTYVANTSGPVILLGVMKMAPVMLQVTVPPRTNLVMKAVMTTAMMMFL